MKNKILIIAAHPDDEILGCGGFLSKFKNESVFKVVFIAEGSTCRFKKKDHNKPVVLSQIKKREKQAIKALNRFNINKIKFYNNPCGELNNISSVYLNKIIENEIIDFNPDTILTHSETDLNLDHRVVFNSVLVACRPIKKVNKPNKIYSFEVLSSSEWKITKSFLPNYYIKLSQKNVLDKWNALKIYSNEIKKTPHPRSLFGVKTLANYRGLQIGEEFAEAYKLIRSIDK
jgi:LmbE family N-acetylglucosaminyl deacetylase